MATTLADPTTFPLVQRSDITYLGSFAVPNQDNVGNPMGYGGHALGYNPVSHSLFFGCHDWYQLLAEVSIPAFGETASILKNCTDVTEGTLGDVDPGDLNGIKLGGNLVYNGRLITTAFAYYDADSTQRVTHGVSANLDLDTPNNFNGWYGFTGASASPRALAGYMTPIPTEWQPLFGGPAFTGQGSLSIISNSSDGPAATVFDPAAVGVLDPIPGTTVVYYPFPNSHPDFEAKGSMLAGMAFPRGSRTVLFFGTRAQHPYCYGLPEECEYSCSPYKGPHNEYKHAIWAYDANDLLRVKNGELDPWEVMPYATWEFSDLTDGNCASTNFGGAVFDPEAGILYVTEAFGESPAVHAFQINSNLVNLTAVPPHITPGQSSTLTWSAGNATACTGTNFNTGGATSGSVSVSPASTTTYTVTCDGVAASATVLVITNQVMLPVIMKTIN
ncbi:MAG: hypothetical protein H6657_02105 [Ardenticatenaceae bacterium]|nr:hypothetical protein [Ardenticatenaceae bacterium]